MSPKKRSKDKHLPPRVYSKHGAYYFVDCNNKWNFLGKTLPEAMANWSKLIDKPTRFNTMNQIFDRYMLEIAPKKAERTYKGNQKEIAYLRTSFGNMEPEKITAVHIYGYLDNRGQKAKVRANREKALLSHVFNTAIRWGIVTKNPCFGVKRIPERPRERYIEHSEFLAVYSISSIVVQCAMEIAYIIGQRGADIFKILLTDLKEEGIELTQSKTFGRTHKKYLIPWTPELVACIDKIMSIPRKIRGLHLFCNRKGQPYSSEGFSCLWQKAINKAIQQDLIKERFTFQDIRAKAASDSEDAEYASKLLGHANSAITKKVYMRKRQLIKLNFDGSGGVLLDKLGYIRQSKK